MNTIEQAKSYSQQAIRLCENEKYEEALPLFSRAIDLLPGQAPLFFNRGRAYYKLQRFQEAITDYTEAIGIEPNNAELYSARGLTYHQTEQQPECLADLDRAVRLEPENPYRYSSRAFLKARIGMVMSAMEDYQKAIELDPEDAIAYNNLGMLQEQLGYTGHKKSYEKADALTGGNQQHERPDLRKVVADYEAQKKKTQGDTHTTPPPTAPTPKTNRSQMTPQFYLKTLRDVFTSREAQTQFWAFLRRR